MKRTALAGANEDSFFFLFLFGILFLIATVFLLLEGVLRGHEF